MTQSELSLAERKVVFLMREMGEYEKIEIRCQKGQITVVSTHTTKEDFPLVK